MDVARLPRPTSWNMLLDEINYIKAHPEECKTLIIDTIDWAESLCVEHICAIHDKKGIEDFGYGNGYVYAKEEFGRFLNDRIINFEGDIERLIVEFLQKPDGDTTQEHLIDRLEKLIFQISMVANISDENFGTSSGIAMKYKLQAMSNLEKTKERKFTSGMNRRYRLIFSNPVSGMKKDDWVKIRPHFTPNFPANVQEESEIARNLDGIVSQETQLGVLSIVDNVQDEIKKLDSEQEKIKADPIMSQMFNMSGGGENAEK